jgi:hypothetical protein
MLTAQLGYVGRDYKKPLKAIAAKTRQSGGLRRSLWRTFDYRKVFLEFWGPMAFSPVNSTGRMTGKQEVIPK